MSLEQFIQSQGGMASTPEIARHLGIPSSTARAWAADCPTIKRIGSVYVFDLDHAEQLAADLIDEEELESEEELEDDADLDDEEE